ncbi:MAG: anthranilate phosphoribosyltransferase [Candidatus Zixiibacteriota bacterium]
MADEYLKKIVNGEDLSQGESRKMMLAVGTGEYTPVHVAAILTALKVKGETVAEIAGCAAAFRELAVRVPHRVEKEVFDCCGTGGDCAGTFNISTAAALVTAAMGVATAKHGNRAVSSKSGSADVIEALGIGIDMSAEDAARCLEQTEFCFLFAPNFHPAMKHVAPVRRELGIPTLFNLLGPLLNPAGCTHQIIGTPDCSRAGIIAEAAHLMGLKNVMSFHNDLGIDEMIDGSECCLHRTRRDGVDIQTLQISNGSRSNIEGLKGGGPEDNAAIIMSILEGENSIRSNTVALNAAIGLVEIGRFANLDDAREACAEALKSGKVLQKLNEIREFTGGASNA